MKIFIVEKQKSQFVIILIEFYESSFIRITQYYLNYTTNLP